VTKNGAYLWESLQVGKGHGVTTTKICNGKVCGRFYAIPTDDPVIQRVPQNGDNLYFLSLMQKRIYEGDLV
jgi:hypothetical protein